MRESLTRSWREALSREDIRDLLELRDWKSWTSIAVNWGLVAAAFALVARWPNPLTVVAALFVIGARQLGLAILMHDAAHRALFRGRRLNDWAGNWLCAFPCGATCAPIGPTTSSTRQDLDARRPGPRPRHAVPDHSRQHAPQDLA